MKVFEFPHDTTVMGLGWVVRVRNKYYLRYE